MPKPQPDKPPEATEYDIKSVLVQPKKKANHRKMIGLLFQDGAEGRTRQIRRDDVQGCTNVAGDRDVESDSDLSEGQGWPESAGTGKCRFDQKKAVHKINARP